jgi:hypothetical protein
MNFKSIVILGLGIATLGLSLPAHADSVTTVNNDQGTVVTGDGNLTINTNRASVRNTETLTRDNSATLVGNRQRVDVQGFDNTTINDNSTEVQNRRTITRSSRS